MSLPHRFASTFAAALTLTMLFPARGAHARLTQDLIFSDLEGPDQVCLRDKSGRFLCTELSPDSGGSKSPFSTWQDFFGSAVIAGALPVKAANASAATNNAIPSRIRSPNPTSLLSFVSTLDNRNFRRWLVGIVSI